MTESAPINFTADDLAKRWRCSVRHIYNMMEDGELRYFHAGGRLKRVPLMEVERWESGGGITESDNTDCAEPEAKESSSGTKTESAEDAALASMRK